jgi:hypothetical protein
MTKHGRRDLERTSGFWWSALVITHRYLGIAMSIPMLVWFLSGFVMMYVQYPHIVESDRLRSLEPISWHDCCQFAQTADDNARILFAQVENTAGGPVLRVRRADGGNASMDLAKGEATQIDFNRARTIALGAARRIISQSAQLIDAKQIETDQWTVGLAADAPLFRFAFDDIDGTHIYVSGTTGQVVLWTTATQRFWNWLGAIPHWFYFAELRKHTVLWGEIVIWAALLGTFLTALGLYLGIAQIKPMAGFSPYRGWRYWHHFAGLLFGIATLAWALSGLISMNPWGFLRERFDGQAHARLEGQMPQWTEVRASLSLIRSRSESVDAVSVVSAPLDGRLYWLVKQKDGTTTRLDAAGKVAAVSDLDLADAAHRIAGSAAISEAAMLNKEDAYYFQHDERLTLPIYRVVLRDGDRTRYYIDPKTGTLLRSLNSNDRAYRWLFGGLHRLDFASWIRARPIWDVLVLGLMTGALSLVVTGAYLAVGRARVDVVSLLSLLTKRDGNSFN